VIIHGFAGSIEEIKYLWEFLQKRGIDVRIVSLAGHGGTKKDLTASTHTDWIKSVDEVISELAPNKVDIIGFSMGGLISVQFAAMTHVNKLVFINTPIYFWNIKVIVADIIGSIFRRQFERIAYYKRSVLGVSIKSSIEFLRILSSSKRRFVYIRNPSLILQCKGDESVWPDSAEYIKRKIGVSASLRYYSGGRHQVFSDTSIEYRDSVCEDIYKFLRWG